MHLEGDGEVCGCLWVRVEWKRDNSLDSVMTNPVMREIERRVRDGLSLQKSSL